MKDLRTTGANGGWVAYRPDIRILDCTIRDGGLINDHKFDDAFVRSIYHTCADAGVDYVEFGYKASKRIFQPTQFGKWKFCEEDDLRRIVDENPREIRIAVMADADRTDYRAEILPKEKSVIDCIRIASYIHQIPAAVEMINDATDKGYETFMQLMATSVIKEADLREALTILAKTPVSSVYIVDSFGSLYSEQVRNLTTLFLEMLKGTGKHVGFHGHNNQQLAFSNTIEAVVSGANRLDTTIAGIGRGAGNCPTELLMGFLHNPKFHLRPILRCCRDVMQPLSKQIEWGYTIPYALTGSLNQHPRAAIEWQAGKTPTDYVAFYDKVMQEES